MWSSSPEIFFSEDEIYLILHPENTITLTEFPSPSNLIPASLQLTGSCGLVMAQVIRVEIKMNSFFDLKLSISSVRADCEGRHDKQLAMKQWKGFPSFYGRPTSDRRTWECPRGLINLLLCGAFRDVVHHHVALHQMLQKLLPSWWLPKEMDRSHITGLRFSFAEADQSTSVFFISQMFVFRHKTK